MHEAEDTEYLESIKQFFADEFSSRERLFFQQFMKAINSLGIFWENPTPFQEFRPFFHRQILSRDAKQNLQRSASGSDTVMYYYTCQDGSVFAHFVPDITYKSQLFSKVEIVFDLLTESFCIPLFNIFDASHKKCVDQLFALCEEHEKKLEGVNSTKFRANYLNKKSKLMLRIEKATRDWSFLVSAENQTTTKQVNGLLTEAIIQTENASEEWSLRAMEALVKLLCDPDVGSVYAHYVSKVYSCITFERCRSVVPYKYGRMLAAIDDARGGGGGTDFTVYLKEYRSGAYDPSLIEGGE